MTNERLKLIKNIRLIDAGKRKTDACDLLFSVGEGKSRIVSIGKNLPAPEGDGAGVFNAHGQSVCPAFTDLRCAIPEPGHVGRESLKSGLFAAARGGYARVLLAPASKPLPDTPIAVSSLVRESAAALASRGFVSVPVSKGGQGEELCDLPALFSSGASAVSCYAEKNEPSAAFLLAALSFCKEKGLPFFFPAGCASLDRAGAVSKGRIARHLKDPGIDPASELLSLSRAILLSKELDMQVVFPLVTLKKSVEMLRKAKNEGVKILAGTAPQYFSFAEEELLLSGGSAKFLPPLRSESDRLSVIEGLADGAVDFISSDHDPHTDAEKQGSVSRAAFGAVGLETAFAAGVTNLVLPGHLSLYRLIELMALTPASILGVDASLRVGGPPDLCFIDPDAEMLYNRSTMHSRSANTPFLGHMLKGRVTGLFIDGVRMF